MEIRRLSTGIREFDNLLQGGVPQGFTVAIVGEPGTGKTIFSLHFIWQGLKENDLCIYLTTEESRESLMKQANQFGMTLDKYLGKKLIIIDALMREKDDEWNLQDLEVEKAVEKVIQAKQKLGYGKGRLVIDSISAFFLKAPASARSQTYYVKRVLNKWNLTVYLTSQYAITTSQAFGFGVEHIADGIIRFRRSVRNGELKRYVLVEKMRQTNHDKHVWEIDIVEGKGLTLIRRLKERAEDYVLPAEVAERIKRSEKVKEKELE